MPEMPPREITISLNGKSVDVPEGASVAHLLIQNGYGDRRVAVECNGEIVPRSLHDSRLVQSGDRFEIVQAIGGG